jgi:hypothetical protein
LGCTAAAQHTRVTIEPYDDACSVPDLCRVREEMLRIIEQRDAAAFLPFVSDGLNDGIRGVDGRSDLASALVDARAPTWDALDRTLRMGGSVIRTRQSEVRFCAPYASTRYPDDYDKILSETNSDGYAWVVVSASAPVHERPQLASPVLGSVSHELVAATGGGDTWWNVPGAAGSWIEVYWRGEVGYVQRRHLWSPNDPRLCMSREGGGWKIDEFRDATGLVR